MKWKRKLVTKVGEAYRGLEVTKIVSNITIRQSAYDFLFDFNRNYASI